MHKCPTCHRTSETELPGVCAHCAAEFSGRLTGILHTWQRAHDCLTPGQGATDGSSRAFGSKPPCDVQALSWVNGTPILDILHSWERMIREERHLVRIGRLPALLLADEIARTVRFHLAHATWTTGQAWADEMLVEVRELHNAGRAAARLVETNTRIQCPGELAEGGLCGKTLSLPSDRDAIVYCHRCGTSWDQRRLALVAMSTDHADVLLPAADVAALLGISEATLRARARRGEVRRHGGLYSIKDARKSPLDFSEIAEVC